MTAVYTNMQRALVWLSIVFSIAYLVALIGMTFNVTPPFPFGWAASALLMLQACMLILAAMLVYDWLRAGLAALLVIVLSTLVEQIGVSTGFPFGAYFYTTVLQPHITSQVPLAVSFAWVLVVFASYGVVRMGYTGKDRVGPRGALLGSLLAISLDLAIEPVAVHIEHYWVWTRPGSFNYYSVPLTNFIAWFLIAWILISLVDVLVGVTTRVRPRSANGSGWRAAQGDHEGSPLQGTNEPAKCHRSMVGAIPRGRPGHLVHLMPLLLFSSSLFMFVLVDLTHGYYAGVLFATLPALLPIRKRITQR